MRRLPSLGAMRVFEAVGQTGSFTRAGERLNLTQSAVSRQVRHLEQQLGEALLVRHHHRLELTAAGALLLQALGRALHEVEATVRLIREKSNVRRLRVNVPPTFARRWLMPRLKAFLAAQPDIDLSVATQLTDSLAESGLLDCAVRFGDGQWPGLHATRLMTEQHVAVCAPALLPLDLGRATLIHVLAGGDRRYLTWAHWLDAAGLDADTAGGLEFDLLDLAIEAACDGLGVAVADRAMVAGELAAGRLIQPFPTVVPGHESYWFVTRGTPSPAAALLRDWMQHSVRE